MTTHNPEPFQPDKSLHYLVKFFSQKEHAEAFLRGELYAKKLACFKHEEEGRGDPLEGTMGHLQLKEGAELKITATRMDTGEVETVVLTSEDLAEPVSLGSNLLLSFNVFCMFGIYGDSPELETIRKDQRLMLPERCFREFGSHFVFINAARQFLDRVKKAAGREGYGLRAQPVGYYDPSTFDGYMQGLEGAFRKPGKFAYQQEFRIAFDTVDHPGPLTLNVGDLSDIALMGQEAVVPLERNC